MLALLQLGATLLQGKKADDEARKQNQISAYMGDAPSAETGNTSKALMGALPGLLGGLGGGKNADTRYADPTAGGASDKVGNALQDSKAFQLNSPLLGQSGGGSGAASYGADNFQLTEPTGDLGQFKGFSLLDDDERL